MRGTDLTDVDVRVTLVHELTHALQDQRFDLSELDDTVETSRADFASTALVEGDATSVEDDYLFSLPQTDQDAYFAEDLDASPADEPPIDEDAPSGIPPVLDLFESGPHIFGPRYIAFLRDAGGMDRVDRGFTHPPRTEEEIIDPVVARRAGAVVRVATPKLQRGERRRGEPYEFGALSLSLVLASRCSSIATTSRSSCSAPSCHRESLVARPTVWPPIRRWSRFSGWTTSPTPSRTRSPTGSRARCSPAGVGERLGAGTEPPAPNVVSIVEVVATSSSPAS